jgi:hypothetical protein
MAYRFVLRLASPTRHVKSPRVLRHTELEGKEKEPKSKRGISALLRVLLTPCSVLFGVPSPVLTE